MDINLIIEKVLPAIVSALVAAIVSLGGLALNIREHRQKQVADKRSDLEKDYERVRNERDDLLKRNQELEAQVHLLNEKCQDCPEVKRLKIALDEVVGRMGGKP